MRRLRWKLDLTILPMFLITQALQFMDKTSLNYANLFGYQTTLNLKGQQFNYLSASMFYPDITSLHVPSTGTNTDQWYMRAISLDNIPAAGSLGDFLPRESWPLASSSGG